MVSYLEAIETIGKVAQAKKMPTEFVSLDQALGRSLGLNLFADENLPPFDNSAMDGYAINSHSTIGATDTHPLFLGVAKTVAAGDQVPCISSPGVAIEIMTGAPLPVSADPGAPFDTVVRLEDVVLNGGQIRIDRSIPAQGHIRRKGQDIRIGDRLFRNGTLIGPEQIMILAALGVSTVEVYRRPRIAIINTGNELQKTGPLSPGKIRDSNGPYLRATLRLLGAEILDLGIVGDDPSQIQVALSKARELAPDLILTTGAVSVGKFDFIHSALKTEGGDIFFHKVAIRPGKPLLFGQLRDSALFGLPGNPIATVVGLRFFVIPYLKSLFRQPHEEPTYFPLVREIKKPMGLQTFLLARIDERGVEVLPKQSSSMISPLVNAKCWAILSAELSQIDPTARVATVPLHPMSLGGLN